MSNKLRIQIDNATAESMALRYNVQKCNPGRPWDTLETFEGQDKQELLSKINEKYPKAKFR